MEVNYNMQFGHGLDTDTQHHTTFMEMNFDNQDSIFTYTFHRLEKWQKGVFKVVNIYTRNLKASSSTYVLITVIMELYDCNIFQLNLQGSLIQHPHWIKETNKPCSS